MNSELHFLLSLVTDPIFLAGAAVLVAVAAAIHARSANGIYRNKRKNREKRDLFHQARHVIKTEYAPLVKKGLRHYKDQRLGDFKLLGEQGWIFDEPQELGSIKIRFGEKTFKPQEFKKTVRRMSRFWPQAKGGVTIASYSEAVKAYDKPALWSEGTVTYRLVDIDASGERLELVYELGNYHDATDTQEAFGFVSARGASLNKYLPKDPFDFRSRCASTAICTLTLVDSNPPRFLFHRRNKAGVQQGIGQFHIVPAGEFEPAVVDPNVEIDFDFWINIQREYAEEFLGLPDGISVTLHDRPEPDHPTFRLLQGLYDTEEFKLWEYGLGLNPVTLKPEILAIAVLSPLAAKKVVLEDLQDHEGMKRIREFTYQNLSGLIDHELTNPAAHALFKLAWRDRQILLSHPPKE